MGKLSKEEEDTLKSLQDKLDAPDDVAECRVRTEDGRDVTLTGSHAERFLRKVGLWLEDDEPDPAGAGAGELDEPAPTSNRYFRK